MSEPSKLWTQLPGEHDDCWRAFLIWLGQDRRSIQEVSREVGISRNTRSLWSKKYNWEQRSAAYDRDRAEAQQRVIQQAIDNAAENSGIAVETIVGKMERLCDSLMNVSEDELIDLPIKDRLRLAAEYAKSIVAWRYGVLATATPEEDQVDWDGMSDEDLEAMHEIQERVGTRKAG